MDSTNRQGGMEKGRERGGGCAAKIVRASEQRNCLPLWRSHPFKSASEIGSPLCLLWKNCSCRDFKSCVVRVVRVARKSLPFTPFPPSCQLEPCCPTPEAHACCTYAYLLRRDFLVAEHRVDVERDSPVAVERLPVQQGLLRIRRLASNYAVVLLHPALGAKGAEWIV